LSHRKFAVAILHRDSDIFCLYSCLLILNLIVIVSTHFVPLLHCIFHIFHFRFRFYLKAVCHVRLSYLLCVSHTHTLSPFLVWFICRLIWLLVHMATFFTMLAVLLLTWEQFIAQYFVINLKDPLYPVENVPFPAVSICPNNRLSKQAVINYALEL